ncbi:alpha/beta hydrolase [Bacteroides pyogenes]|uniref:alpha/beta hydrolase n=1 Tax=Bacteroides pyogenes TaxID=310300 RepID=UPI001BA6AC16|nr:alpha/beta hydrolase [Bacteroides pyogenes]MBR8704519.1 hypothetical protein [Bacteroides pyogenes]
MRKKSRKSLLKFILSLSVIVLIFVGGGSWYLIRYALTPSRQIKQKNDSTDLFMAERYPFYKSLTDSLKQAEALRDTFITNKEGIRLHAYYVRAARPTRNTAVIVHGYTDNAMRMMMIGYLYSRDLGFNILLPELQYHGASGGNAIQMGWKDRLDVMEWMDVADRLYGPDTKMVVHGISMGAATTMMVSGERQPLYVKAYVEDCGYTDVWDQFAKELDEGFRLPPFPLLHTASRLCDILYGWNFKEASALKQVARCKLPMLFIHGDKDRYVPTRMVYPLYEAKCEPKELWIVPGAAHAVSYQENPEEYTRKVRGFIDRHVR